MPYTIDAKDLRLATRALSPVIPRRPLLPAIGNVHASPGGINGVVLTATNLDYAISISLAGSGDREGLIERNVLKDSVKGERGNVTITDDMVAPNGAYPMPAFDSATSCMVGVDALIRAHDHAISAVASDTTRPVLCHILLEFNDDALQVTAADGCVLSTTNIPAVCAKRQPILVRGTAMTALVKALRALKYDGDGVVDLAISDSGMTARAGNIKFWCRLGDGTFPKYGNIFPTKSEGVIELQPRPIVAWLRNLPKPADKNDLTKVQITATGNSYQLTHDSGSLTGTGTIAGDWPAIWFDGDRLATALAPYGDQAVTLAATNGVSPLVISSGDSRALVMPVMPKA